MQTDIEQEKDDAEFGEDVDGIAGLDEARRAEGDAEQEISDDRPEAHRLGYDHRNHTQRQKKDDREDRR
jgi:hypothetical protein